MRVQRGFGLVPLSAMLAVLVFVALARSLPALAVPAGLSAWRWGPGLVLCGACYFLSHVARATRLAMVSGQLLGVSLRTAALAHLFVAPWSIIMPFKLDEILRWGELWRIGGTAQRALIACLIDRTSDGIVLLALLLAVAGPGGIGEAGTVVLLLSLAIGLSVICFILVPSMLELVQQYLFEHHFGPRALPLISLLHHVRVELTRGRETIARALPWLLVCTLVAWLLELTAVLALLGVGMGQALGFRQTLLLLLQRASQSASILMGHDGAGITTPDRALSVTFLAVLALAWLPVAPAYFRRWRAEPRRHAGADSPGTTLPATWFSR